MVHHKRVNINTGDNNDDNDSQVEPAPTDKKQTQIGNHPRGINRLSSTIVLRVINSFWALDTDMGD